MNSFRISQRMMGIGGILLWLGGTMLSAQAPAQPPSPSKNMIPNGDFERVITFQNLYDGVDSRGKLRVPRASAPIFYEGASFSPYPFAPSVSVADVNGDRLPDLVISSPLGFLYWYPNIGKKGEPAFDFGRLVQTFLGPAPRIHAVDWNGDGKTDIVFGNVDGEINVLLNQGSAGDPQWITGMGKPRWSPPATSAAPHHEPLNIRIGKDPISVGNYAAPVFADWNKDGLPDLIVGEGSYSANSVRIWLNTGSRTNPAFRPDEKFYLAFGEGREQLTLSVYDWNSDGIPDLLVGDREGKLALYLGAAASIADPKKVETVEFTKFIKVGGQEKLGLLISMTVCDYNEDGIPDLVYATSSGLVNVALGKGKKEDPELDAPVSIQGVDTAKDFKQPSGWENTALVNAMDQGSVYAGMAPLPAVLSKEDNPELDVKEGKRCFYFSWYDKFCGWFNFTSSLPGIPTGQVEGVYSMTVTTLSFILGKEYELSFWRKGNGMKLLYALKYEQKVPNPKDPKAAPFHYERLFEEAVSMGGTWGQYRKTYRFEGFKNRDVNTNGQKLSGTFAFTLLGKGDAWLDEVKLLEVVK